MKHKRTYTFKFEFGSDFQAEIMDDFLRSMSKVLRVIVEERHRHNKLLSYDLNSHGNSS